MLARLGAWMPPRARPSRTPVVDTLLSIVSGGNSRAAPGTKRFHLLYSGAQRIVRTLDEEAFRAALVGQVHTAVAALAQRFTFVHAGVVGWKGKALLLPGASYSGKSTLVAALLKAGAEYFSDEFAVLGQDGRVYPYAKPLYLRSPNHAVDGVEEGETRVVLPAEELGAVTACKPLPVRILAANAYREGAAYSPVRGSRAMGLAALTEHAFWSNPQPARTMAVLAKTAGSALFLSGERGEAEPVAERLLQLLADAEA